MAEATIDWNAAIAQTQERYDEGTKLMQDMTGWDKIASSDDVTCFKRLEEASGFAYFKAEFYVDQPAEKVARHLYENWGKINSELQPEDFVDGGVIGKQSDDVQVKKTQLTAKGPVSARELHFTWVFLPLGEGTFAIAGSSVPTGLEPSADHVLADARVLVVTFEPAAGDANRTHFTSIAHIDPKGSVPAMVVNAIMDRRAAFYVKLREMLGGL